MTAGMDGPGNGGAPLAANAIVQPQANMSSGGPPLPPATCSGAMNAGVPTAPVSVADVASSGRAIPKSMTRGPSGPSSTFAGLKSRCTTPASWIAASAVAVPIASRTISSGGSVPRPATRSFSEGPSMYSLTM